MTTVVPDSSVIVKWLNKDKEENLEQADRLIEDAQNGKVDLIAPELAKYEIGNVLLYSKKLSTKHAAIVLELLHLLPIVFVSETVELSKTTYDLAFKLGITYYDAAFMALALKYKANLVTENLKHQSRSIKIKSIPLKDY